MMKLELESITKFYGKYPALQNVSAVLTEGVYGLLGPNGAGKTTLINILIGILPASGGVIHLDGENIVQMGGRYFDQIGYMPPVPSVLCEFYRTGILGLYVSSKRGSERKREHRRGLGFRQPGGTPQQADWGAVRWDAAAAGGLPRPILNDPHTCWCWTSQQRALTQVSGFASAISFPVLAKGRIILLATHIVSDVELYRQRILLLRRGTLVMQGTPRELEQSIQGKVWECRSTRRIWL